MPERLFPGLQGLVRALARQSVGEDFAHQAEAPDQVIRPVAVATKGTKPDRTYHRIHHLERDHYVGFQPYVQAILLLLGGFGRQVIGQPGEAEDLSLLNTPGVPRQLLIHDHAWQRWHTRSVV